MNNGAQEEQAIRNFRQRSKSPGAGTRPHGAEPAVFSTEAARSVDLNSVSFWGLLSPIQPGALTLTWSEHLRDSGDSQHDLLRRQVAIAECQLTRMLPLQERMILH